MKLVIANTEIHQDAEGRFLLKDLGGEDKNKPSNFLRSDQTQKLIEAINRCSDSSSGSSDSMSALSTKEGVGTKGVTASKNWSMPTPTVVEIPIVAEDGKRRKMTCLPESRLPFWMVGIRASQGSCDAIGR